MKIVCYYHDDCLDGFGAACAVKHWFDLTQDNGENTIDFIPMDYGDELDPDDYTDAKVLAVDFSFLPEQMDELLARAKDVKVIDHHASAIRRLENDYRKYCVFDTNHCGAVLTWKTLLPDEDVPMMLKLIEDRDLWRWEYFATREVNAALRVIPRTFERWMEALLGDESDLEYLQRTGTPIIAAEEHQIDQIVDSHFMIEFHGHTVPCVNSRFHLSEALNRLAQNYPFAVGYFDEPDGIRKFSLRSEETYGEKEDGAEQPKDDGVESVEPLRLDGMDVAVIAEAYGGGGHPRAAGFTGTFDPDMVYVPPRK